MSRKKVTIKDIAEKAGVSKTAVSFAFNDPDRLSQATLEKILRVAKEMGYAPHPVARSLSTRQTGILGVLCPQDLSTMFENPFFTHFIQGIGQVCDEEGFFVLLATPVSGSLELTVNKAAVDGFIVMGLNPTDPVMTLLRRRGIPSVAVDSDPVEDMPAVNIDDQSGAWSIMNYVLRQGHRHIAIVTFESEKDENDWENWRGTMYWRMKGYVKALRAEGLSLEDPQISVLQAENTLEGGVRAFETLWQTTPHPTAIVAMSDILALGIMKAAQTRGIQIPQQLSVAGFDDIPDAQTATPPLTTVHQPAIEKGERAAEMLVSLLNGEKTDKHVLLPTMLVVRESVGPRPQTQE